MPVTISDDIRQRLERLTKISRASSTDSPQTLSCALKQGCPDCVGHPGVTLQPGTSTLVATRCKCVANCRLCSGSCLPTVDGVASYCSAPNPQRVIGLLNEAKIPSRYYSADITKFDGFNSSNRNQKGTILNWLRTLQPGKSSGLLLSGPVGMGKSWLLAALAKQLAFQGISVRYTDFFQLVHELRDAYSSDMADKSSLRPLQSVDVLIIDELGKGRNSEWELSVADSLISERYNGNKCVVAATNYPLRGSSNDHAQRQIDYLRSEQSPTNQMNASTFEPLAQRIGSRMFSRLSENCICLEVHGPDRRRG